MNPTRDWSWRVLLACVAVTAAATTATSLTLSSLPLTYDSFVIPKLAVLGLLSAVALGLWGAAPGERLRWHRGAFAALALLALAVLSTGFGLDPLVAYFGRDAANGLLAYLCYGAVFFLILQMMTGASRVLALTRAVVGGAVVVSMASLFQAAVIRPEYLESIGLGGVGYLYGRGGGVMGNPDYVGAYLVVPLVLSIALAMTEKAPRWRGLAQGAAVVIGLALAVTQVRAGWVGGVVGVVALVVMLRTRAAGAFRKGALLAGVVGAAGLVVALVIDPQRMIPWSSRGLDALSSGRLSAWQDALAMIADRPLLGTGPDSFTLGWYRQATALADRVTGVATYFEDPHNFYLTVTTTLGVPALIALGALVFFALRAGRQNLRLSAGSPSAATLSAGWLAAFAGLLITLLFAVTTIPTTLLFFVTTAVLLAPTAKAVDIEGAGRTAVTAVASLVAVACLVTSTMPLIADYHLGQYMRTRSEQSLEQARSTAPWEKTVQLQYLSTRAEAVVGLLGAGGAPATSAIDSYDNEAFALVRSHPHELQYSLKRIDLLGQAAALGGAHSEKALTVIDLALLDYPQLTDLKVSKARALNNLEQYEDARALLEPLAPSVLRDTALAETLLLLKKEREARALIREIKEDYAGSAYAQAFLSQPSVTPYLSK